ncbi:MAG: ankyrin repeat domain-containing protein, partial [Verrucomicrobia bacterium]|nr:ankyrin repeat domain-containing protein [Verrucomicrobiota bacterium]
AAREVEHAKAIGTQEEVLARFASKGEFPSPVNSPPAGPEKLLMDEIALAEQQLEIVKRRQDVGRADTEEVLKASRDVLALKRQLAAMQSRPKDIVDLPASASAAAPDEEALEIERLKRLLANSPDLLNAPQGPENETPLQTAARLDQARVVEYLLKAGADINALGGKGVTALYRAAEAGHKRMVELLLQAGADVNAAGVPKLTPLLIAVARERAQVVQTLLDAGASSGIQSGPTPVPTRQDSYDNVSPLGLAVLLKNPALVEAMVRRGASLDSPASRADVPLQIAVSRGDWETAALLLKLGARPEGNRVAPSPTELLAIDEGIVRRVGNGVAPFPIQLAVQQQSSPVTTEFLDEWVARGGRWDVLDSGENSLLHLAVKAQSVHAVEWLLRHQTSPNRSNAEGTTPMMLAVWRRMQAKDGAPTASADRIVAALIAAGVDLNRTTRYTDDPRPGEAVGGPGTPPNGVPLSWVAVSKEAPLFAELVAAGADPNARNSRGMPLLWFMAASLRSDMDPGVRAGTLTNARTLLTAGANPDLGFNGTTPLRVAVDSSPEMVDLLLEFKADPNRRDDQGRTPLERVTDPLAQGHDGLPPEAQERIVRALRAAGARDDAPDFQTVRLVRPSSRFTQVVFRRNGTNDANHFTLLEALAVHYRVIASPGIPDVPLQIRPGSAVKSTVPSLPFPDWTRVVIRRPDADGAKWTEVSVDAEVIFAPGGCDKDVSLRWGDVIEVPERDHAISEEWPGLPNETVNAWERCLAREVTVHVQGKTSVVELTPKLFVQGARISSPDPRFTLLGGLSASGLLRASSDPSRVVLRRKDPASGVVTERTFDCRKPQGDGSNVWLQKGDEIIVPDL